jgi:energy-coupling factor transport system ATP-binding protein
VPPPTIADRPPLSGRGRLTASELAAAALFGDVCVGLCLLVWLLPFWAAGLVVAVTPMAALSARHRLRVLVAATVGASTVGLLVVGPGLAVNVVLCAVVGAVVGRCYHRHYGWARSAAAGALIVWPPLAAAALGYLALFSRARQLALAQVTTTWQGMARALGRLGADGLVTIGSDVVTWAVEYWWLTIPLALLVVVVTVTAAARLLSHPVLVRLDRDAPRHATADPSAAVGPIAPLPVRLDSVSLRYPSGVEALRGVSTSVAAGEMIAIVGANGSGKSTLARVLCGTAPTSGTVERPGGAGLGRPGGTALIVQRPETQVLGVRVRDDVVWGLIDPPPMPVEDLLARVGLAGLADRDTSTLSGGELQRLAVAAALARRPALVVSDESTAMIDPEGRRELMTLLRSLTADGVAVVHITHEWAEAAVADRIVRLDGGRVVEKLGLVPPPALTMRTAPTGLPLIRLESIGHVYDAGTPWAHRALANVDLTIDRGECVLVVGANGSGKSTLAGVMTGLVVATEGRATVDNELIERQVGRIALGLQHARLQLLGETVGADVADAAGLDDRGVAAALARVGLDPVQFTSRKVDELSGGQLRRVALAGLLARRPVGLVLDEPYAGLDPAGRVALTEVLNGLRSSGLAIVVISHDLADAEVIADRTVVLDGGRLASDRATVAAASGGGRG